MPIKGFIITPVKDNRINAQANETKGFFYREKYLQVAIEQCAMDKALLSFSLHVESSITPFIAAINRYCLCMIVNGYTGFLI